MLKIAIEGCSHGELQLIYRTILSRQPKVDLLLICGDFQSVRNTSDLNCVEMPAKYRELKDFHLYATGVKQAPITTIFIGGNHEASNLLQSNYYGGWVAPNIYFLGFAGVVWFGGIRIGGVSGIYNHRHYKLGHYEQPPYTSDSIRSIYHTRELEIYRLSHLNNNNNLISNHSIDIFLSHDWPNGIWNYGNLSQLLHKKPYFKEDIESGKLGSLPLMYLLQRIQPAYWFCAHLHIKFGAVFPHPIDRKGENKEKTEGKNNEIFVDKSIPLCILSKNNDDINSKPVKKMNEDNILNIPSKTTQFMALDKALPGRQFLHIISIPQTNPLAPNQKLEISFDSEWLAIIHKTHHLLQTTRNHVNMPAMVEPVTKEELLAMEIKIKREYGEDMIIPNILPSQPPLPPPPFPTSDSYNNYNQKNQNYNNNRYNRNHNNSNIPPAVHQGSLQTDRLLSAMELPHIWTVP
eukprot:gene14943-20101_t